MLVRWVLPGLAIDMVHVVVIALLRPASGLFPNPCDARSDDKDDDDGYKNEDGAGGILLRGAIGTSRRIYLTRAIVVGRLYG